MSPNAPEMMRRLREEAATGLDLSPGDPVAAWALESITRMQAVIDAAIEWRIGSTGYRLSTPGSDSLAKAVDAYTAAILGEGDA